MSNFTVTVTEPGPTGRTWETRVRCKNEEAAKSRALAKVIETLQRTQVGFKPEDLAVKVEYLVGVVAKPVQMQQQQQQVQQHQQAVKVKTRFMPLDTWINLLKQSPGANPEPNWREVAKRLIHEVITLRTAINKKEEVGS